MLMLMSYEIIIDRYRTYIHISPSSLFSRLYSFSDIPSVEKKKEIGKGKDLRIRMKCINRNNQSEN